MIEYNFYNPTRMVFGEGKTGLIGQLMADFGVKKVLLVMGGGSIKQNGVYQQAVGSLREGDIEYVECWGVRANPELEKVREAIVIAKKADVDAVLAIGGGSVIDSAKAVAAGVYADDVWCLFDHTEKITKALPIFTVLTLSATASEMNCNAVLSNHAQQKKYGTGSPLLYPRVSIIDPLAQQKLPWNQTVNGALDAMAHIMEYYFMGQAEETVIAVNEALLKSIMKAVSRLKENEADLDARANLAWAVTMALNGTSAAGLKGGDWACHSISHSISAFYPDIAHGAALGVLFPAWMEFVSDEEINIHQFNRFSMSVFDCIDIEEGVINFRKQVAAWNGAVRLSELGVKREAIEKLAEMTLEAGPVGRLKVLDKADIIEILERAF